MNRYDLSRENFICNDISKSHVSPTKISFLVIFQYVGNKAWDWQVHFKPLLHVLSKTNPRSKFNLSLWLVYSEIECSLQQHLLNEYLFRESGFADWPASWVFAPLVCFWKSSSWPTSLWFISLVIFSSKHVLQYTTERPAFHPATSSSFSNTEHHIQKWFMHLRQVYLVLSKQEERICSDLPAILFEMIKTSC